MEAVFWTSLGSSPDVRTFQIGEHRGKANAHDDIIRQYRWYLVEKDAPDAAFRFLDAVEKSVEQLIQMPGSGAPKLLRNLALVGLRVWPVEGFEDMRIFYLVQGESLKVIRILHGKRDINRILEGESATDDMVH